MMLVSAFEVGVCLACSCGFSVTAGVAVGRTTGRLDERGRPLEGRSDSAGLGDVRASFTRTGRAVERKVTVERSTRFGHRTASDDGAGTVVPAATIGEITSRGLTPSTGRLAGVEVVLVATGLGRCGESDGGDGGGNESNKQRFRGFHGFFP